MLGASPARQDACAQQACARPDVMHAGSHSNTGESNGPVVGDLQLDVVGVGALEGVHEGRGADRALHWVPLDFPAPVAVQLLVQRPRQALRAQVGHEHVLHGQRDGVRARPGARAAEGQAHAAALRVVEEGAVHGHAELRAGGPGQHGGVRVLEAAGARAPRITVVRALRPALKGFSSARWCCKSSSERLAAWPVIGPCWDRQIVKRCNSSVKCYWCKLVGC
jgi:hypothetical protein